jgi:hypothetical protein
MALALWLGPGIALLAGCSTFEIATPTPEGDKVQIIRNRNHVLASTSLGTVDATSKRGGSLGIQIRYEDNEWQMRNETAARGGDTLLPLGERGGLTTALNGEGAPLSAVTGLIPLTSAWNLGVTRWGPIRRMRLGGLWKPWRDHPDRQRQHCSSWSEVLPGDDDIIVLADHPLVRLGNSPEVHVDREVVGWCDDHSLCRYPSDPPFDD